jgi:mannose-6-phosphate isomerase-like protein (cupin superfamily)
MHHLMKPEHHHRFCIKKWGFEYWFENNDKYCGKIIQVRQNEWSSSGAFHYHKIKDETFLVTSGTLLLDILILNKISKHKIASENILQIFNENEKPVVNRYYLGINEFLRIRPGVLHRFSSFGVEATFTETSTTHLEEDSYRIKDPHAEDQLNFEVEYIRDQSDFPKNTEPFSYQYPSN